MRVVTLTREVDINTLEPVIQARLLFTMDDLPEAGEYAYRCRIIGEKILEALEVFKVNKK